MDSFTPFSNHLRSLAKMFTSLPSKEWQQSLDLRNKCQGFIHISNVDKMTETYWKRLLMGWEQKMQLLGEQRQNQDWPGLHHQRFPPFQMHSVLFCCKWAEMQNRWYGSRKQCNHLPNYHCSNNSTVTAAKTGIKQKRETACTRRQTASAPQPPRNWHFREDDLQLFCCGDTIIFFSFLPFPWVASSSGRPVY